MALHGLGRLPEAREKLARALEDQENFLGREKAKKTLELVSRGQ
jgi:hypothetical protein